MIPTTERDKTPHERMTQTSGPSPRQTHWQVAGSVALFICLLQWIFHSWLPVWFKDLGMHYGTIGWGVLMGSSLLGMLPLSWMPIELVRPSQIIYWVLYLTVIIPSILIAPFAGSHSFGAEAGMIMLLLAAFAVVAIGYRIPLLSFSRPRVSKEWFWTVFAVVAVALESWVVYKFRGRMRLVGFHDVYAVLRYSADEVLMHSYVRYAVSWLAGGFHPWLMVYGLTRRRILLFVLGAAGQVLLYSTNGMKSYVLLIGIMAVFYLIFRSGKRLGLKVAFVTTLGILTAAILILPRSDRRANPVSQFAAEQVQRIFADPGVFTSLYRDFFESHSHTYFSHVHGPNMVYPYPYQRSLGVEVGEHYVVSPSDMNAHFFATDGIAALGVWGMLVAGFLCGALFWVMDSCAQGHDLVFGAVLFSVPALSLSNGSLFTSFASGGIWILCLCLLATHPDTGKP